jgi:DnaJ homolog subfamily C member 13
VVKELMNKGVSIYLLDVFCNSTNALMREKTAELFAKMMNEKLSGPRLRLQLSKFLPNIFMVRTRTLQASQHHLID